MVRSEEIEVIVHASVQVIDVFLRGNMDIKYEIEVIDLPVGRLYMAPLTTIKVFYTGEEPFFVKDRPFFCYDMILDANNSGEVNLFCFDVTGRDTDQFDDPEQANIELSKRLTAFSLPELTHEDIVLDFMRKIFGSMREDMLSCFSKN